jgi:glycosyltransferase involved in cell wall biosynthesis
MFPSLADVSYGAFVQRNRADLLSAGYDISENVLVEGRKSGLRKLIAYILHYVRLIKLLGRSDIPCWYVHYASHHCVIPAIGGWLFGKKIVVNIHGDDLALAQTSWYRRAMSLGQELLLLQARLVIVPSSFFRDLTIQRFPRIDVTRIVISASGGVDYNSLSSATKRRPAYWESSHAARTAEIGYVGRIDQDKGWQTLFNAFIALPEAVQVRARLHFWGEGKDNARLRELIAARGKSRVEYHGAIAASDLQAAHARFDFHVVPSLRESLGLSALEGLAAGHVLICSAIRPFTDITEDCVSALHFNPTSEQCLLRALTMALRLPDHELSALGASGQAIGRAFDRSAVVSALAQQIDSCMSS